MIHLACELFPKKPPSLFPLLRLPMFMRLNVACLLVALGLLKTHTRPGDAVCTVLQSGHCNSSMRVFMMNVLYSYQ